MMKTIVVIACCIACASCAKKPEVITFDNGYSFQRKQIAKGTTQWTLRRDTPQQSGVVAQAIVTGDTVISVLPTPVHYHSCIPTAHAGSDFFLIPHAAGDQSLHFRFYRNGKFSLRDKSMDRAKFEHTVSRLASFSTDLSVVLEVQTPCELSEFTNAIAHCVSIAGGGFATTYKGSSRLLEIEEIEEPVERDEQPDIPIVIKEETAEPEN